MAVGRLNRFIPQLRHSGKHLAGRVWTSVEEVGGCIWDAKLSRLLSGLSLSGCLLKGKKRGFSKHETGRTDSPQLLEVVTHGIWENVKGTAPLSPRETLDAFGSRFAFAGIHCEPGRHARRVKVVHSAAQASTGNMQTEQYPIKRGLRKDKRRQGALVLHPAVNLLHRHESPVTLGTRVPLNQSRCCCTFRHFSQPPSSPSSYFCQHSGAGLSLR